MIPYNTIFNPPAPFLTISISAIYQKEPTLTIDCLLDTGADISVIPQALANSLNLDPTGLMIVEGFNSERQKLPLFAIDATIETKTLAGIEVLAYQTDYAILGRDVLNRFRLLLDGPAQNLEIL